MAKITARGRGASRPRRVGQAKPTINREAKPMIQALRIFTCLMGAALAASAASAETLRVGKAGAAAFSFVPADVGAHSGIFKKHRLDLEISSFGGDAKVQQAMAADSIDIGLGSGPGLAFLVKGSPAKGIAAMADPPLTFALVVRNDDSIKTLEDLKGKKVGVSTVGSVTGWLVSEIARRKGWGYEGMEPIALGNDATRVASLKTNAVDGAIVNLTVALKYAQSNEGRVLLRFGDLLKDFHVHVIFATDKAIANRPEALRNFLAAWFETIAFMQKNKGQTVDIAKDVMGTDTKLAAAIYDEMMPMFNNDGHFKPRALAALSRSFIDMKTLPKEPDMQSLINESFLPKP
jgi:ABC-type nitrate/sulfonate/bicarbonate transport system substrate-binding protein